MRPFGRSDRDGQRNARLRLALLVILAAVVALAGCNALPDAGAPDQPGTATVTEAETNGGAPTVTATASTQTGTESPPPTLAEKGVDVNVTWNRTQRLVGVNATRPSVTVRRGDRSYGTSPFIVALTGSAPESPLRAGAYYLSEEDSVVFPTHEVRNSSAATLETTLAHEYAHAIQHQHGWSYTDVSRSRTTEPMAVRAYSEGFAEYVEQQYAARYSAGPVPDTPDRYENRTTHERYSLAPYFYGRQYFERNVNETGNLSAVAENPPASTEQVLHDTDDTLRELWVRPQYSSEWTASEAPLGELATRVVLRDELPRDRAVAAAEGWGADRLLPIERETGTETGYVWVHRWDAPAEADEFEAAMAAYLDGRRSETDEYEFQLRRLTPETTAVFVSRDGFSDAVSISADSNESVPITIED